MLMFYIDESGTGLGDRQTPFFVLSAVSIEVSQWPNLDSRVSEMKRSLIPWAKSEDFEIKGRDLRRGDKLFRGMNWQERVAAIHRVAQLIADLPCSLRAVRVDKRELPEFIGSNDLMYRLALARLLEGIDAELQSQQEMGMLMFDMRSDLHSSVQDRRLVDAYRDWLASRSNQTNLIELPWFGFSAFYAGLQLADFVAYLIDYVWNEHTSEHEASELRRAYARFERKVHV